MNSTFIYLWRLCNRSFAFSMLLLIPRWIFVPLIDFVIHIWHYYGRRAGLWWRPCFIRKLRNRVICIRRPSISCSNWPQTLHCFGTNTAVLSHSAVLRSYISLLLVKYEHTRAVNQGSFQELSQPYTQDIKYHRCKQPTANNAHIRLVAVTLTWQESWTQLKNAHKIKTLCRQKYVFNHHRYTLAFLTQEIHKAFLTHNPTELRCPE